jgi:hypothetical protein
MVSHRRLTLPCTLLIAALILGAGSPVLAGTVLNPTPGTGSYAVLANGGFETGLANWPYTAGSGGGFASSNADSFLGDGSIVTNTLTNVTGEAAGYARQSDEFTVTGGETYVLSGFFNTLDIAGGKLYLDLSDVSFDLFVGSTMDDPINGTDWFFAWGEFTVPSTSTSMNLRVRVVRDSTRVIGELGYVDEVAVTPISQFRAPTSVVPLPSAALAGFGLLAVLGGLRHRRRSRGRA